MGKKFSAGEKASIVMEGLSDKIKLTQLCNKYQISKTQYYRWKKKFINGGIENLKDCRKSGNNTAKQLERLNTTNEKLRIVVELLKEKYSTGELRRIVAKLTEEGFSVSEALECLGMNKSTYYYQKIRI